MSSLKHSREPAALKDSGFARRIKKDAKKLSNRKTRHIVKQKVQNGR